MVGINVCDDRDYFVRVIGEIVEDAIARWKLAVTFDRSEIEIRDGHAVIANRPGAGIAWNDTAVARYRA